MKRLFCWLAIVWLGFCGANAEGIVIEGLDAYGNLTFNTIPHAESYRIEWAPTSGSPWTNFQAAAEMLDEIAASSDPTITVEVPFRYRVVATVTNPPPPLSMVLIPGGTNSGTDPDFGAYSLTVDSFYMEQYPVTKTLWDEVYTWATHADRGANAYSFDNNGSGKAADHPVHTVNWYDVVKWCNARSEMEGRPAVYTVNGSVYRTGQHDDVVQTSAAGYRLPTEEEWEYAARGGLSSQRFPWGDTINHDHANYRANGSRYSYDTTPYTTLTFHPAYDTGGTPYTSPVGSFAANGYGLYDMAGNVWEWCFTASGSNGPVRGGSWWSDAFFCGVGFRNPGWPGGASFIGFRAVLPAQ